MLPDLARLRYQAMLIKWSEMDDLGSDLPESARHMDRHGRRPRDDVGVMPGDDGGGDSSRWGAQGRAPINRWSRR